MDKLVYALNLIVDFIDVNDRVNEREITDYLFLTGFGDYEVRQILALLDMRHPSAPDAFRVFSPSEKRRLAPEAADYLNKLILLGVLDMVSAESVLEKTALADPYRVGIEQVKELALLALLEKKSEVFQSGGNAEDLIQ